MNDNACTSYKLAQKLVKMDVRDYDRFQEEIEKIIEPLEQKLSVAKEALEFYADNKNYPFITSRDGRMDRGERAREVLKRIVSETI